MIRILVALSPRITEDPDLEVPEVTRRRQSRYSLATLR
jgi:hypothetical protein